MHLSCAKHDLQGVWGRAAPPAGSARGGPPRLDSHISAGATPALACMISEKVEI